VKEQFVLVASLAVLALPPCAIAQAPADRWTFSVMPYLWLPNMNGDVRYGPPATGGATANVSIDAGTLLSDLDFALMVTGEARKGRWSFSTDLIYLDLSSAQSTVRSIDFNPGPGPVNLFNTSLDEGTQTNVKGKVWTLTGGYALVNEPYATLDMFGGFRNFDVEATTNWQLSATVTGPVGTQTFARSGSVTKSDTLWDAIVGVRGRFKLGEGNWFAPYYLDVGGGDSKLTWQAMTGVGYSYKWGDFVLAYRYLAYEQSDNKLIEHLKLGGIALGVNVRF